MSVETIAVVGRGPNAERVATALTATGVTVLRLDPGITGLSVLGACDLVVDCSVVDDPTALEFLRTLEDHMTRGSILLAAGVNGRARALAEGLRRPDQFLAIEVSGSRVELAPTERTAPGALWAVRSFVEAALGQSSLEQGSDGSLRRAG